MKDWKQKLLTMVDFERERQDLLHPSFPTDNGDRMMILVEELGEIAKAYNEKDTRALVEELVHVSAVAIRWAEEVLKEREQQQSKL